MDYVSRVQTKLENQKIAEVVPKAVVLKWEIKFKNFNSNSKTF
jgi:hypothetical protein